MALNTVGVKRLIFDLDDTLFDTHGQLNEPASREACAAMIKAGLQCTLEECLAMRKHFIASGLRRNVYLTLAQHFGRPGATDPLRIAQIGFLAFHKREIKEDISLFEDTLPTLNSLASQFELFLVTQGSPETQAEKVKRLKLSPLFKTITYVDNTVEKSKTRALREICQRQPLVAPELHISIGNRIDSEIHDSKELGMQTVLIEHGEYLKLEPRNDYEIPDHRIHAIGELRDLLT